MEKVHIADEPKLPKPWILSEADGKDAARASVSFNPMTAHNILRLLVLLIRVDATRMDLAKGC